MRLLLTGGAGFIGSNLLLYLHRKYSGYTFMNADKLSYAANPDFLKGLEDSPRYFFSQTDLAEREAVHELVHSFRPEGVIHLAAESHVDNSISGPELFVMSNVVGTFNLLEECRQFWNQNGGAGKKPRFHHVSTDEVYGSLGSEGLFTEQSPYAPNSPYSASKASSDMLVRSYNRTYGMNTVTTSCSNNFGPHQHDEKLIPTVIRTALGGQKIPVYGKGENIRDWLFVTDHCEAIDLAFHSGRSGEVYNIGGENEWRNIDLVKRICEELDSLAGNGPEGGYKSLISFVKDRPGHDERYAIDASKAKRELGWKPAGDFRSCLRKTISWYLKRYT